MRLILFFVSFTVNFCLGQTKELNKYYYYESSNEVPLRQISLNRSFNLYNFCFEERLKFLFGDSIVNKDTFTIANISPVPAYCVATYGLYSFKKKGKHIYINCFSSPNKKYFSHKQYPLVKSDTSEYFFLFSTQNDDYPLIDGYSVFEKDTVISSYQGDNYNCYMISEHPYNKMDINYSYIQRIYIDKVSFLPVRYEFLDSAGCLKNYYLIDK